MATPPPRKGEVPQPKTRPEAGAVESAEEPLRILGLDEPDPPRRSFDPPAPLIDATASPRRRSGGDAPIKARRTNEAALYAWKFGVFGVVLAPVGVIAGIAALIQLRFGAERDRETGAGLALGGLAVGSAVTTLLVAAGFGFQAWMGRAKAAEVARAQSVKARDELRRLVDAIEVYRDAKGAYPAATSSARLHRALVDAGAWAHIRDLHVDGVGEILDPWGHALRYQAPGEVLSASFDLYSTGPNGDDERGAGDDIANFDPHNPELLPVDERENEQAARRLFVEARSHTGAERQGALDRLVGEFGTTRAGRLAAEEQRERDAAAETPAGPSLADLDTALGPLEGAQRWGACLERCRGFLAAGPAPDDKADVEARTQRYQALLADAWLAARGGAVEALAFARRVARTRDARPEAIETALTAVAAPLEDAARTHAPALDDQLAAARAGLVPALDAVREEGRSAVFRAAVRERVWPRLLRRDLDGAAAEVERLAGEFPNATAVADLERSDVAELRSLFERAVAGAATRIGAQETVRLRGAGWVTGKVESAAGGRIVIRDASAPAREIAAVNLEDETVLRLADLAPRARDAKEAARRSCAAGLLYLASGEIAKARTALTRAAAEGADVARYLGKAE